jgi:hypothetical protein
MTPPKDQWISMLDAAINRVEGQVRLQGACLQSAREAHLSKEDIRSLDSDSASFQGIMNMLLVFKETYIWERDQKRISKGTLKMLDSMKSAYIEMQTRWRDEK